MSRSNSKILVVGATGTVGSAVVLALVAAGEQVKAATRNLERDFGPNVEGVRYDFDDVSTFDAALAGVDRVFYLSRPADMQAGPVAEALFAKAAASGVRHIVNMSVMGVDGEDIIPLRQAEIALEGAGVPYTLLRPNWFMQNFSTGGFSGMIREQAGLFLPAGDAAVSFIDTRDIAEVAAKILVDGGHEGQAYALTGPEALMFTQLAASVSEVKGAPVAYVPISEADFQGALASQGVPESAIGFMLGLFGTMRAGYNTAVTGDVQTVLGRAPRSVAAFCHEFTAMFG